ncbi:MAG: sodium:calcium antiporter [Candidatus Bathyarchaeota archaeon]|nr:sodium:calcium antiporter [Candidatus Bathyarchaeota archaeon]
MAESLFADLLLNLVVIGVSFLALNWASNLAITNALKVSTISQLGKTSVGFTLIAMSTTLPELTVAVIAATTDGAALSVGNVLGSNIFNISGIIGLSALLIYLRPRKNKNEKRTELNVIPNLAKSELNNIHFGLFISSVVPMILIYIATATWAVGLILLFIFSGYMYSMSKVRLPSESGEVTPEEKKKLKRYIAFTIGGALGVVASANFLVDSAVAIAESVGVPQTVIGATIIAFGTSLPELTVSLKSVLRGHSDLAFGNLIGASFINTTLILGITFFVPQLVGQPLIMNMNIFQNLVIFSIIVNLFFWYFLSREKIGWKEGAIFLFIYMLFLATTLGFINPTSAVA